MKLFTILINALALYTPTTTAIGSSFSPKAGITYTVAVPSSTANTGIGPIYLQLSALTSHTWVGLGIGQSMAGSTMFIIYTSSSTNNVTISPRTGTGHIMPNFNALANITLLEGSGVTNGVMTANVRYIAAPGLLDYRSTSSSWISAWQLGPSLDSADPAAAITQHDGHDQLTFDLTRTVVSGDENPFVGSTANATGGSAGLEASGSAVVVTADVLANFEKAHGILMAAVVVVLFPFGALVFRVFGGLWLHVAIQVFGLCVMMAGFGLGIRLAQMSDYLFNNTHTLLGTVVVSLFMVQPLLGLVHHHQYKKTNKRLHFGIGHIWYGRVLIILGVINGGLGLQLANNSQRGDIAYLVISCTVFILYILIIILICWNYNHGRKSYSSKAAPQPTKESPRIMPVGDGHQSMES